MQFLALILALVGAYLVDSSIKNRPPIGTVKALVQDPSDLFGTISELNGTWTTLFPPDSGSGSESSGEPPVGKIQGGVGLSGKMRSDQLVGLSWSPGQRLRPDAATALEQLNKAYRARFGVNLAVTDSYRSYAQQVALKAVKGKFAATPGKSNHGWGIAVDLGGGINRFGTPQHNWMLKNAPHFGWHHPAWAKQGQSTPEPWHWEFGR